MFFLCITSNDLWANSCSWSHSGVETCPAICYKMGHLFVLNLSKFTGLAAIRYIDECSSDDIFLFSKFNCRVNNVINGEVVAFSVLYSLHLTLLKNRYDSHSISYYQALCSDAWVCACMWHPSPAQVRLQQKCRLKKD